MKYMVSLVAVMAILGGHAAMACNSSNTPNPNSACDGTTGTTPPTTSTTPTVGNVSASAGALAAANSASISSSRATGGNASASLNNSGNSLAIGTGGKGGAGGNATANIDKGAVQNTNYVAGGSISSGAVQNSVSNTAFVSGGSSTSHVGNVGASVGNVSTGASTATASNNGNGNGNGSNNTEISYQAAKTYRNPVETAYAANLTSGLDTCLGSVSAGAQSEILGLTFGKTLTDKNCVLIKQAKLLNENGFHRAACLRMQMGPEGELIKKAMEEAGETCPALVVPTTDNTVVTTPLLADAVSHEELSEVERRITTKVTSK